MTQLSGAKNTDRNEARLMSDDARTQQREREALRETYQAALRASMLWMPLGPIICIAVLWGLKNALITADEFIKEKAEFATEPFMPVLLFVAAGTVFAAFLTWRITQSSGAVGKPVNRVAAGCILLTCACCVLASFAIFSGSVPGVVYVSVGLMALTGIIAVYAVGYVTG